MDPSELNSPELQNFLNQEKQKAMVNEMIGKLTSTCWDKCVTGTPGSKFSSSESNCLTYCAQRYMDMSLLIMKRLQQ
ncbi:Mitochondrial import inner membrane translocase subunit tim8 [Castilleja foliolosa]|uniref:Mitochondrial import inner membrane translocase subunit n=1 Tax=Castilleja foliolosa TaxID=1961234 RepID=A0ABD3BKD8_9LAMI